MRRHERSELALVLSVMVLGVAAAVTAGSWQAKQNRDAAAKAMALTGGDPRRGAQLMIRHGCAGCHHIPRVPNADGRVGPSLHQFAGRSYIAGALDNTPDNLVRFIQDAPALVPGTAMPRTGASAQDARDMAAFLYTRS
jgi:cytochrome c